MMEKLDVSQKGLKVLYHGINREGGYSGWIGEVVVETQQSRWWIVASGERMSEGPEFMALSISECLEH
jgi:hypothetical protein